MNLNWNIFTRSFLSLLFLFSLFTQSFATTSPCLENVTEQVGQNLGDTRRSKLVRDPKTPLAELYSSEAWDGRISDRVARLVKENPEIKLHNNVPFQYVGDDGVTAKQFKTIIEIPISAPVELKKKVELAFSRGVVSFPVAEGGGHLYTRLGNSAFDAYTWFSGFRDFSSEYMSLGGYMGSRSALEPIVALRAGEELRLRDYINRVKNDARAVLSRTGSMAGSGPGDTARTKTNNAPLDENRGHNCTSWICTSPVGQLDATNRREPFIKLTGAKLVEEIHTNPGWLNFHLAGRTNVERNPVLIFWAKEGDSVASRMPTGENEFFRWDFSPH